MTTYGLQIRDSDTTNPMDYEARTMYDDGEMVPYTMDEAIAFAVNEELSLYLIDDQGMRCGTVARSGRWQFC